MKALVLALLVLALATPAFADSTADQFVLAAAPQGTFSQSGTLNLDKFSLTLLGFASQNVFENLFEKNLGPTETGLGLALGTHDEISRTGFIQLDLTQILTRHPSEIQVLMSSIQGDDAYDVWGSNTQGILGAGLLSNQTKPSFTIPDLGKYDFVSIGVASGDVLIEDITVHTSEPSVPLMLCLGFVVFLIYKRMVLHGK